MTDATDSEMLHDSRLGGAFFRGLPKSSVNNCSNLFKYTNCLDEKTVPKGKIVTKVQFDISRFCKYQHSITFNEPVSVHTAIESVEKYLSEPLTEEYYESIKDDTFHNADWEDAKMIFHCRGAVLTDAVFLETVNVKNGLLTFFIGS